MLHRELLAFAFQGTELPGPDQEQHSASEQTWT